MEQTALESRADIWFPGFARALSGAPGTVSERGWWQGFMRVGSRVRWGGSGDAQRSRPLCATFGAFSGVLSWQEF